ncbi:MAG: AarF/ABC1/UbiB kinase family protein [Acidobacteria bacterium]|nr:AarF/ABC1/UbiB kinase family protein [Acidobacteriota bacterium]MCI0722571.1 AarF/ABC1/UbiB kinase family protein [Acidobacteriota bacterium]
MTLRLFLLFALATFQLSKPCQAEVPLPTPKEHYQSFDASQSGLQLFTEFMGELDPATQKLLMEIANAPDGSSLEKIPRSQVLSGLRSVDWKKWKAPVLEVFLHHSNVLDVIPPSSREWIPIVHDGLLYFLDHLDQDRLLNRFLNFAYLPAGGARGDRILQFASRTPTFQKIGQILARNTGLEADIQTALQTLENTVQTSTREELVRAISTDLGRETLEAHDIQFADRILAEASVGAVIRASLRMPGESERREVVCKVIKPYVRQAITEEGAIIDELTRYFEQNRDFYELGEMPLSEMFQGIRKSMSDEIRVEAEQQNLLRAARYYKDNPKILVPQLYPFSTNQVTVMEFVRGGKISSAFGGDRRQRGIMARRLSDALTSDVVFSKQEEALFHGDPHAGNVFHVLNDVKDPYRIALLDWGLFGLFTRSQRVQLIQLILGIELNDPRRLKKHLGALAEGELSKNPEKLGRLDRVIEETLRQRSKRSNFDTLGDLIVRLGKEGYVLRLNITLFIKSQVTIAGILAGLDPALKQDEYLMKRAGSLVRKELHKRLLYTLWFPAWKSNSYGSMLSNEDVKDVLVHNFVGWFRK